MKTIFDSNVPKYIDCKHGFLKLEFNADNTISFAGFTPNLRTATPLYCSNSSVYDIAKKVLQGMPIERAYFAIVEPALIGFNKGKEIC